MRAFARLLDDLLFTPGRNARIAHLADYFRHAPDPDRGWTLAALTGALELPAITPARLRGLVAERVDAQLFRLSQDHVGDLAETVALIWPDGADDAPSLGEVVDFLGNSGSVDPGSRLAELCDRVRPSQRLALIKLATGGIRPGISARLARAALAKLAEGHAGRTLPRIEELCSAVAPPYRDLFRWLEGGAAPQVDLNLALRPVMLATHLDDVGLNALIPQDYIAEWKWDGIRIQASAFGTERRLYTRTGEDIGGTFPDVIESMTWQGTVDGELLIVRDGAVAPFADLQRRLGRKRVGRKTLADSPAHLRLYDLLHDGTRDLRGQTLVARRHALAEWITEARPERTDISEEIPFSDWRELREMHADTRAIGQEGLMLKRRDAPYTGGRPTGPWFKWKHDPLGADCVMIYAQRGQGKHASFYASCTFAAWSSGDLVPVGKAEFGFDDNMLEDLDRWVRENMTDRFGPVRAVKPEVVLEVAFDSVQRSTRHKSGLVLRAPRIRRIRWDKPATEADRLSTLQGLIETA